MSTVGKKEIVPQFFRTCFKEKTFPLKAYCRIKCRKFIKVCRNNLICEIFKEKIIFCSEFCFSM